MSRQGTHGAWDRQESWKDQLDLLTGDKHSLSITSWQWSQIESKLHNQLLLHFISWSTVRYVRSTWSNKWICQCQIDNGENTWCYVNRCCQHARGSLGWNNESTGPRGNTTWCTPAWKLKYLALKLTWQSKPKQNIRAGIDGSPFDRHNLCILFRSV